MKKVIKFTTFFLIVVLGLTSCKKGSTDLTSHPPVKPPIANAGVDQLLFLPTDSTVLSGSALSTGNTIINYKWTRVAGPLSFTLADINVAVTKVNNLVEGIYEFELKVTDNNGLSASDKVIIKVVNNHKPVADAGPDKSIQIFSCYDRTAPAELDGTGSSDPENNIERYKWVALYGPAGFIVNNSTAAKTGLEKLSPGGYSFELTVTDLGGLYAQDTVLITVIGNSGIPAAYDLDLTVSQSYTFLNNHNNPWEDPPNYFYDETHMSGKTVFQPLGEFTVSVFQFADSAALSNILYSSTIQIRTTNANSYLYLDGELSGVNFKQLIRDGGGPFTGAFTVTWGSAEYCDPNVFSNLLPLAVTGNLNAATQVISLRIYGRTYF